MKLDRKLNLVMEIVGDDDEIIAHVHHQPISREIFEQHHMFIAKTMNVMYSEGLHPLIAMRDAFLTMKDLAREPRYQTIERTLFAEMWRLTNVLMAKPKGGWETVPFQEVIDGRLLPDDDVLEVQNYISFFTSASWVHGGRERKATYDLLTDSGLRTTSLDATAYRNGLPTSTPAASTGETATPSLIPS